MKTPNLLTFNTPFSRYRYLHLLFGIHSASEVFQRKVSHIIEGLGFAFNYQDDIIIWASTLEELDKRVEEVLRCIEKSGMKLNKDKCVFGVSEVTFLGHLITADGIKADPEKVKAVKHMPLPESKEDLQRFLGIANYLCKFVPNFSENTSLLRKLLEKDVLWRFEEEHKKSVDDLKTVISNSPIL